MRQPSTAMRGEKLVGMWRVSGHFCQMIKAEVQWYLILLLNLVLLGTYWAEVKRRDEEGYYDSDKYGLQVVKAARTERFDVYLYLIKPRRTQHTLLMHLLLQEWTHTENSLWCASPFVVKGAPRLMVLPNGLGGMWNRCKKNEKRDMVVKLSTFDVKNEKKSSSMSSDTIWNFSTFSAWISP